MERKEDILVIGGGPAGIVSAVQPTGHRTGYKNGDTSNLPLIKGKMTINRESEEIDKIRRGN